MDNSKEYYFITVFEKLDLDNLEWPDVGNSRCWGFYTDKNEAFEAVKENRTDLNETIYYYALIESYGEGISNYTGFRQFFKFDYDSECYNEIEEPKGYERFSSFAFG